MLNPARGRRSPPALCSPGCDWGDMSRVRRLWWCSSSAIAIHRVGFGLILISLSVLGSRLLNCLGLLMVSARHVIARFQGEGRLMTRWLPLTSAAVITMFGCP